MLLFTFYDLLSLSVDCFVVTGGKKRLVTAKSTLPKKINELEIICKVKEIEEERENVKEVEPFTAGIIPYKLQHKTLGNIILHDFAGHSEYYSSPCH